MNTINPHKVGLVFGGMLAIWHAMWAVLVFAGAAKPVLDWILGLHFLNFQYSIDAFSLGNAAMLVLVTGAIGYVLGAIFAWLWNMAHRAAHMQ